MSTLTDMKVCAVVPARGGSKGIKNKNICPVGGVPLINYTLETLLRVDKIDRIIVSTDCDTIASTVQNYSSKIVLVKRPARLASDTASSDDVLLHVLDQVCASYTHVLYAEPTSPFRTVKTIEHTIECLHRYRSTVTVVEDNSIFGTLRAGKFVPFVPGEARRRQDREVKYKEASLLYGLLIESFKKRRSIFDPEAYPIIVSAEEALDINVPSDLRFMEFMLAEKI